MTYQVELRPAAVRALKRIDHQDRDRLRGAIALLGEDPRPPGATSLRGRTGLRVHVGDYRIIHTIDDDVLIVAVVTLGHRRDIYDRFSTRRPILHRADGPNERRLDGDLREPVRAACVEVRDATQFLGQRRRRVVR